MKKRPPQFIGRWLSRFIDPFLLEGILGDLEEKYADHVKAHGAFQAKIRYAFSALTFLKLRFFKPKNITSISMIRHYLITAFRNIKRHGVFSAINIFGLATAMTLCLLIILFYVDQSGMESHNPDANRTYRILTTKKDPDRDRILLHATSPYEIPDRLEANFPQIESTSTLMRENGEVKFHDKVLSFSGLYASGNFFDFFQYNLQAGNKSNALSEPMSIVLSEELAERLFGADEALNQSLYIDGLGHFTVTGIVKEPASRSHIRFDLLLSLSSMDRKPGIAELKNNWEKGSDQFFNYVRLKKDAYASVDFLPYLAELKTQFPRSEQAGLGFQVQPLDDINFGPVVRGEIGFAIPGFVFWFLAIIAMLVMVSAVFNYVGLSVAQALRRAKEVGIKKAMGAEKRHVLWQFLVEAQVLVFISWVLAMLLLQVLIPVYNSMKVLRDIDGSIDPNVWSNTGLFLSFLLFALFIGLISGGYPAIHVSRFGFREATKKSSKGKSQGFLLRKILTFLQYSFSLVFIVTAIVINKQSNLFFEMEYGFDQENMISFPAKDLPYEALKTELLRNPHIESVSRSSALPALSFITKETFRMPGAESTIRLSSFAVNEDFLDNLDLSVKAGTNFRPGLATNTKSVLVNEAFCNEYDITYDRFISGEQTIRAEKDSTTYHIVGIVEDFKFDVLFRESGPLVLTYDPDEWQHINVKFSGVDPDVAASEIETVWREFDKVHAFEYSHYQYELADMYEEFQDIGKIVGLAAGLAIIIACIGQFGMILHHVELKTKEVGIRKVLGSTNRQLIVLLSRGYIGLTTVALLLSVPLAWWMNNAWTQRVGYHVEVGAWILGQGIVSVILLSALSVFSLTVRAANKNPVETLKYE